MPGDDLTPPLRGRRRERAAGRMRDPRPPLLLVVGVAVVAILALTHLGEIRTRAEAAMGRGMPEREAGLARSFVLGEAERIDNRTREDFRRSGLSHLLAVSGQNVALLALLALPLLAALGISLRARLVWVLGLIVVYVFLAGADPSIQRAGVMGSITVLATLAGRRSSRFYALALAVIVTLAVNPRIAADVGWQLSFAAVLGILLLAAPLRDAIAARLGSRGWRRGLADGTAMTIAATIATAPLIAFHFEGLSTTTLAANLLALPAVAPAMWLGMLVVAAGQVPGFPVEVLNHLNAVLLAYIAQVAAWCGRPSWAYLHLRLGGAGLVLFYLAIAVGAVLTMRIARWRRLSTRRRSNRAAGQPKSRASRPSSARLRIAAVLAAAATALAIAPGLLTPTGHAAPGAPYGLRVSVLDVGQGDAILLQPAGGAAILVDGGPPGDGLAGMLRVAGVERLGAAIVTHDQTDHAGGVVDLFGRVPVQRLLYAVLDRHTVAEARAAGVVPARVAAGGELRSGQLRLNVLWPPRAALRGPRAGEDPNRLAIVMLARWNRFSMLLTADAEAEATPIRSGPIDVLKVAHHGSDDAGLGRLLEGTEPKLAIVSVGDGNPFGHPTAATLATLSSHGVRTLRTDRDGTVVLDVRRDSIRVSTSD